jgi:hypothetical protein
MDGLRLAVELTPINLAGGRATWNRFGDIRTCAVNIHLNFPFALLGRVLTIPTVEIVRDQEKDTTHLIDRAVNRLIRAGGRQSQAEAAHLLEGIGVVAHDPHKAQIVADLPARGTSSRWEEFTEALTTDYYARFED